MKWAKEKPTENGWYWHFERGGFVEMVCVGFGRAYFTSPNLVLKLEQCEGFWLGPVEPPVEPEENDNDQLV